MEVAIGSNGSTPFQREVREWQRVDPNTGALMTSRLEADRWIKGPLNAYGKLVDSKNVSIPNGTQHTKRKQLEVLQTRTSSGSLQVVRAQTVQTTSSRWSSSSSSASSSPLLTATGSTGGGAQSSTLLEKLTNGGGVINGNSINSPKSNAARKIPSTNASAANDGLKTVTKSSSSSLTISPETLHISSAQKKSSKINDTNAATGTNYPMNGNHPMMNSNTNDADMEMNNHHHLIGAPSLKLSSLMKNTNIVNGRISPLTTTFSNSMSLVQRHQQLFQQKQQQQYQYDQQQHGQHEQSQQQQQQLQNNKAQKIYESEIEANFISRGNNDGKNHRPTLNEAYVGEELLCKKLNVVKQQHQKVTQQNQFYTMSESVLSERETPTRSVNKLRGRSVSTDDLSSRENRNGFNDGDGDDDDNGNLTSEWRRVSKIRRSFQFPKCTSPPKLSPTPRRRPIDLPENSVNVTKIKEELENGRRLNTAMRNNHVDLAALDNILNSREGEGESTETTDTRNTTKKTSTFLTAESLKEIRGKLKKLSDESLYKDDFIITASDKIDLNSNDTNKQNGNEFYVLEKPTVCRDTETVLKDSLQYQQKRSELLLSSTSSTTSSLTENHRICSYRDNSSTDWHSRRKSYGFEKMSPEDQNSMFRVMESSTDSGIGRSGGDLSRWSPTTENPNSIGSRSTVITLGDIINPATKTTITLISNEEQNDGINNNQTDLNGLQTSLTKSLLIQRRHSSKEIETDNEVKRHSIAVDETKYVRDNLRKVFEAKHDTMNIIDSLYRKDSNVSQTSISDENGRRQKRVEFCKTEVHFAAESGRVNIVETDGKPPPTNNFRRRRRNSNSSISNAYLEAINSGLPLTHFGDEKKSVFEDKSSPSNGTMEEGQQRLQINTPIPPSLITNNEDVDTKAVDNTMPSVSVITNTAPAPPIGALSLEEDESNLDEISLRGILKNKPIKPKPYHLGENLENGDSLWGVKLRPISNAIKSEIVNDSTLLQDSVLCIKNSSSEKENENLHLKSVAERIKIVEERNEESGYSTKINLNLSNSPYSWLSPKDNNQLSSSLSHPTQLQYQESNQKYSYITIIPDESLTSSSNRLNYSSLKSSQYASSSGNESNVDELKSTSLIMKTIKSATQFDKIVNTVCDNVSTDKSNRIVTSNCSSSHKNNNVSNNHSNNIISMNEMISANSSSTATTIKLHSINNVHHSTNKYIYSSPIGITDTIQVNENFISKKISSECKSTTTINNNLLINNNLRINEKENNPFKKKIPVAAPRAKIIESSNAVNHQLIQLRKVKYESSGNESDDSYRADEEVKRYLGGSGYSSNEDKTIESSSGSWSSLRSHKLANRKQLLQEEKMNGNTKVNVTTVSMNSSLVGKNSVIISSDVPQKEIQVPVAKPRTYTAAKSFRSDNNENKEKSMANLGSVRIQRKSEVKDDKEPLKVVTGGARQLRDHELSYFGVKVNSNDMKSKHPQRNSPSSSSYNNSINKFTNQNYASAPLSGAPSNSSTNNNNNPININSNDYGITTKWKLSSDKPDLLRHSPVETTSTTKVSDTFLKNKNMTVKETTIQQQYHIDKEIPNENGVGASNGDDCEGPVYENLQKPSLYSRKRDLKRDEMILNEMTKEADQALKAVSKDHSRKEHSHQSLQRPHVFLDTIEERPTTQKHDSKKCMKSKAIQVSRTSVAGDGFHRNCCSSRPSSASSTESLSKISNSGGSFRNGSVKSRSKETSSSSTSSKDRIEYANIRSTKHIVRSESPQSCSRSHRSSRDEENLRQRRSSSRETQKTHASSSEDLTNSNKRIDQVRKVRRSKTKTADGSSTSKSRKVTNSNETQKISTRYSRDTEKTMRGSLSSSRAEKIIENGLSSKSKEGSTLRDRSNYHQPQQQQHQQARHKSHKVKASCKGNLISPPSSASIVATPSTIPHVLSSTSRHSTKDRLIKIK